MMQRMIDFEIMAEKFRIIGHPARVAIINLLCTCGCKRLTVKNIYEELNMNQPTASHHLGTMRKCGILNRTQEAGKTFYSLCEKDPYMGCIQKCFVP